MAQNIYVQSLNHVQEEEGSQLVEFIGILPILLSVALIGWQIFWVGHTVVVTASAAHEGARALAVCGGTTGDANGAAQRASRGYAPRLSEAFRGASTTRVAISNDIPSIRVPYFLEDQIFPPIRFSSTMRTEKCRP